jgi:hypothetical protein
LGMEHNFTCSVSSYRSIQAKDNDYDKPIFHTVT